VYEGPGLVGQLQQSSGHVVHGGHPAAVHHLPDTVPPGGGEVHQGAGREEVARLFGEERR
jgi:hypothetical protein